MISAILVIFVKSSIILTVTFAVSLLARKQSAAFRHWVWTAGLFGALTVPIAGTLVPAWHSEIATVAVDSINHLSPLPSSVGKSEPVLVGVGREPARAETQNKARH